MVDKIVDGICIKLNNVFGKKYKIYTEEVPQGFETPCFFIWLINTANKKLPGNREIRENMFCVQYISKEQPKENINSFPKTQNKKLNEPHTECYAIHDELYDALEYIRVDGNLLRGIERHGEIAEGNLHFFVNYNITVIRENRQILMKVLNVPDIRAKGEL